MNTAALQIGRIGLDLALFQFLHNRLHILSITEWHAVYGPHGSTYGFGIIDINGSVAHDNACNTRTFSCTHNGSEIARILNILQNHDKRCTAMNDIVQIILKTFHEA